MDLKTQACNIFDLREMAKKRVPRGPFEFMDRGTEEEVSLRNNREVFDRIRFRPRTFVDVSKRNPETTIFVKHKMPLVIAPTGTAGLLCKGEPALARAAKAAGIPFSLATGSMTAMERVADEAGGELWFQLYLWPDRSMSHELVNRAKAAGYKALIVTVDGVSAGNREYNIRNGFTLPFSLSTKSAIDMLTHPRWLLGVMGRYMMTTGMPMYQNYPAAARAKMTKGPMGRSSLRTDSIKWDDLDALRKIWPHKLIVKGMLDAHDAAEAVNHGADGVDVSNHGRNLTDRLADGSAAGNRGRGRQARDSIRRQRLPPRQRRGESACPGRERSDGRPLDALWRGGSGRGRSGPRARNLPRGNPPQHGAAWRQHDRRAGAAVSQVHRPDAAAARRWRGRRWGGGGQEGGWRGVNPGDSTNQIRILGDSMIITKPDDKSGLADLFTSRSPRPSGEGLGVRGSSDVTKLRKAR